MKCTRISKFVLAVSDTTLPPTHKRNYKPVSTTSSLELGDTSLSRINNAERFYMLNEAINEAQNELMAEDFLVSELDDDAECKKILTANGITSVSCIAMVLAWDGRVLHKGSFDPIQQKSNFEQPMDDETYRKYMSFGYGASNLKAFIKHEDDEDALDTLLDISKATMVRTQLIDDRLFVVHDGQSLGEITTKLSSKKALKQFIDIINNSGCISKQIGLY